jgi:hypothetical protein
MADRIKASNAVAAVTDFYTHALGEAQLECDQLRVRLAQVEAELRALKEARAESAARILTDDRPTKGLKMEFVVHDGARGSDIAQVFRETISATFADRKGRW